MQLKAWEAGPQSTRDNSDDDLTAGNKQPNTTPAQPAPTSIAKANNVEKPSERDLVIPNTDSLLSIAQEQRNEKNWKDSATSTPRQGADVSVSSTQDAEHIYPEGGLRAWLVVFGSVSSFHLHLLFPGCVEGSA